MTDFKETTSRPEGKQQEETNVDTSITLSSNHKLLRIKETQEISTGLPKHQPAKTLYKITTLKAKSGKTLRNTEEQVKQWTE